MKKFTTYSLFILMLGLTLPSLKAQTVNVTLEPNSGNNTLDVYLTANGASYTSEIFNELIFTVRWPSSASFNMGAYTATGFWSFVAAVAKQGSEVTNSGNEYQSFGFAASTSTFNAGFSLVLNDGVKTQIGSISITGYGAAGLDICSFKYTNDTYTGNNNADFSVKIAGATVTGSTASRTGLTSTYTGTWNNCDFANLESVDNAVISSGSYTLNSDVTVNTVTVSPGAILSVNTSNNITATTFNVEASASGYGQYIGNAISGTFEQYIGTSAGWRHLGWPVTGNASTLSGVTVNFTSSAASANMYTFNTGTFAWDIVSSSNTVPGASGVSLYTGGANFPVTDNTLIWTGTSNSSASSATYTYASNPVGDAAFDGWNLIANPYPCNVDWHTLDNQQSGAFSTYSIYDPNTNSYATYSSAGGSSGSFTANQYIAPGQSIWVKTSTGDNGKSISFANSDRSSSGGSVFIGNFKTSSSDKGTLDRIKLNVESKSTGNNDALVVIFPDFSSKGYESQYDGHKPQNLSPYPNFSSSATSGEKLSINGFGSFDPSLVIPVSFESDQYEDYEIALELLEVDPNWGNVYLVDLYANVIHNLSIDGAYSFTNSQVAPEDRFEIRFSQSVGIDDQISSSSDMKIYSFDGTVAISRNIPKGNLTVALYNLAGQKVFEDKFGSNKLVEFSTGLPTAYYIVKAQDESGVAQSETVIIQ